MFENKEGTELSSPDAEEEISEVPLPTTRLRSTPTRRLLKKITNEKAPSRVVEGDMPANETTDPVQPIIPHAANSRRDETVTRSVSDRRGIGGKDKVASAATLVTQQQTDEQLPARRAVVEWIDGPGIGHQDRAHPPGETSHDGHDLRDTAQPQDHIETPAPIDSISLGVEQEPMDIMATAETVNDEDVEAEVEERLQQRLATMVQASVIVNNKTQMKNCLIFAIFAVVIVCIIVVLSVIFTNDRRNSETSSGDFVEASIVYENMGSAGGFPVYAEARRYRPKGSTNIITEGAFGEILCVALPCFENSTDCDPAGKAYVPGCCLGQNCSKEDWCGKDCPVMPEACRLEDITDNCRSSECYTCDKGPEGEELWYIHGISNKVDCIATGTKINEADGMKYDWAILCGPVEESDYGEMSNSAPGEYTCIAFRKGKNIFSEDVGVISLSIPCQYVQLLECGCGPLDVHPWDLTPPTHPCSPGDCRFLCSDAGEEYASQLCHAFGGIDWFEGYNKMNYSLFLADDNPEIFDIYLQEQRT